MSDTTYDAPTENLVDVAREHYPEGAEPTQPDAPAADDDGYFAPSREEWQQTQDAIAYYGSIVEQHAAQQEQVAYEQRVAELRDQFAELEWTDPDEYERVVQEINLAPHLQRIGQLEAYIAQHQQGEAIAAGEDEGIAILADLGFTGEQADAMFEDADARFEHAIQVGVAQFGGDANAMWAEIARQARIPVEQAPAWFAEQALQRVANEQKFGERIAQASSLTEMVRLAPAYANPTPGTTTTISTVRPDSLKDVARRHFGGR